MPEQKQRYTWDQKRTALARHLRPYQRTLLYLSTAGVFSALANGVVPYLTGKFFDTLISPVSVELPVLGVLAGWSVFLGAWIFVQIIANTIDWNIDLKTRLLTTKLEAGIQGRAFIHLLTLPLSFHKHNRTGEITDAVSKVGWMLSTMGATVASLAPQFLTILIGIGISFTIRPSLAFVLLGGVALYLLVLGRVLPSTARLQEEGFRIWSRAYGDAADAYANVQTIKHAGAEKYEEKKITEGFFNKAVPTWFRMEVAWSHLNFSQRIIVTLTQTVLFLFSVSLIAQGAISVGDLIAFNGYAMMIIGPFVSLGRQWQTVQNGLTALARSEMIFGTEPEIYEPAEAVRLSSLKGEVTFEKVAFAYGPDQPEVLKNVSFSAQAGEVIAFVGETGVGKSTTADLISGYYFPTEGKITIDGHDIRKVNLRDLRSHIAVVPQEVVLFNATVKENIRYGRPDASDAEVKNAAHRAHADGFIEKFPLAYEQEVGERGIKLSVGQKQRVAIARAILRDPRILILDEPTSALDPETESYITTSLEELMRGRTTFIIAHRLSTVRKADRIIVLQQGMVAEEGSHEELLKKGGAYARLYNFHIGLHE